ncbi:MAG: sigma-70 family RNA polymerase sigma factor [Actinomycetota bacterium]|nr:sigma-70 family RNA polymerase sigma factor [Actinomycetota bacterium]
MSRDQDLSEPSKAESDQHTDVLELTPIVRRVLRARVHDPEAVEDLVQETLARLIEARPRISDDGLTAYAVVTARNLAASLGRQETRRRDHLHRLVDLRTPPTPEEETLRQEEGAAVSAALAKLSPREKTAIVERVGGKDTVTLAREMDSTPGGVAVQLARARAKLRVDYLLALKKTNPPSATCRQVLVALSAGDQRRQQALDAGDHLLKCEHCSSLSEPVLQRRRPLAALWPIPALTNLKQQIGQRLQTPGSQATAVAATTAAVAAGLILANFLGGPRPPARPQGPLKIAGGPQTIASAAGLKPYVGQQVSGQGVVIESVPADEGFWIGNTQSRVFVRLTQPTESAFEASAGQHVSFQGTIVKSGPSFARRLGITRDEGAAELGQNPHIQVAQRNVELR